MLFLPVFLLVSYLLAYLGVSSFYICGEAASYISLFMCAILALPSYIAIMYYFNCNLIYRVVLLILMTVPFVIIFSNVDSIKKSSIEYHYNDVASYILNGNKTAINSDIYKEVMIDKKELNAEKLRAYKSNIDQYTSITYEQLMNLKILSEITKNEEIKVKIAHMLSDRIITKPEYSKFQETFGNDLMDKTDVNNIIRKDNQ